MQRDKTALDFAERTLGKVVLGKGLNRFQQIPDPPAFARPALDEPAPAISKQPAGPKPARAIQAPTRVPRLTSSRFFQPRLTAGWAPKVRCSFSILALIFSSLPHFSATAMNFRGHEVSADGAIAAGGRH